MLLVWLDVGNINVLKQQLINFQFNPLQFSVFCRFDRDRYGFNWPRLEVGKKLEFSCSKVPILAKNFTGKGLRGKKINYL